MTYHVRLGDIGHTFEVRCTEHTARVRKGISARPADVVIGTDSRTWLRLRAGELSAVEAFRERTLYARGTSTTPSASRACSGSPTAATR